MFKYVRTMHGHNSAPEICYISAKSNMAIYENAVYTVDDSGVLEAVLTAGRPKYIALENVAASVGEKTVRCLRVAPGMIFETTSSSLPDSYRVGIRGSASEGNGGSLQHFTEGGTDLEIIAHHYTQNTDNLLVTFI